MLFFLLEIFRISTDLDNNIRKIPLKISDSVDVNKVQNNGFEVAADRKESKNNLLKIDNEFHNFCKTLHMIESERKKRREILMVFYLSIIFLFSFLLSFLLSILLLFLFYFTFIFIFIFLDDRIIIILYQTILFIILMINIIYLIIVFKVTFTQ